MKGKALSQIEQNRDLYCTYVSHEWDSRNNDIQSFPTTFCCRICVIHVRAIPIYYEDLICERSYIVDGYKHVVFSSVN